MRSRTAAALLLALGLVGCGRKPTAKESADVAPEPARPAVPVRPTTTPQPVAQRQPDATTDPTSVARAAPENRFAAAGPFSPAVAPPPRAGGAAAPLAAVEPVAAAPQLPPPNPMAVIQPPALPAPPSKEMAKEPGRTKEPNWPAVIDGRDIKAFLADVSDPDPQVRETAVRALPMFGPPGQKLADKEGHSLVGKALIKAMQDQDPAVRLAAFPAVAALGFSDESEVPTAVRILRTAIENSAQGGPTRYHAVLTLGIFGHRAVPAVRELTLPLVLKDPSYETRRAVAQTLGRVGISEHSGPDQRALNALSVTLAADPAATVRMEAMQALLQLGPPLLPRPKEAPLLKDIKDPRDAPPIDEKVNATYIAAIKKRITPVGKGKAPPETDKQVEIWARVVLMRLDPKEVSDDNLNAVARHIAGSDFGARLQALNAFGIMGPAGAKKVDEVMAALEDKDPVIVEAAVRALAAMGPAAKSAVSSLEKLKLRGKDKEQEVYRRWAETAIKVITAPKTPAGEMKK